ncbi:MAG: hypothetical protein WBX15_03250, partial [Thermoanaerobaculia bacterium]
AGITCDSDSLGERAATWHAAPGDGHPTDSGTAPAGHTEPELARGANPATGSLVHRTAVSEQ